MSCELLVIGGGEHARVVIEAAMANGNFEVVAFVDPQPRPETTLCTGVRQLDSEDAEAVARALARGGRLVLGVSEIGVGKRRRGVVDRIAAPADAWANVVHTHAWVSPSAQLGRGVVVMAGAIVNARSVLGDFTVINTGGVVEHDVTIGAFAQVGSGAVIGGGASIGAEAFLGLGCRVRDHVSVGVQVTVGLGAAVVGDVRQGETVIGVPAKPHYRRTRNT